MNIFIIIAITLAFSIIGIGVGYFIFLGLRTKKLVWNARIYQRSQGVRPPVKDAKGNVLFDNKMNDLRLFLLDKIEMREKKDGTTYFVLQKLNKTTPAVTADLVDYVDKKNKWVDVLLEGGTCTLMQKGYSMDAGKVFYPIPHDRANQIKGELATRKDRLEDAKSIMQAISTYVAIGLSLLCIFGVSWIVIEGLVEMHDKGIIISNNFKAAVDSMNEHQIKIAQIYHAASVGKDIDYKLLGFEDSGISEGTPPSIE